MAGPGGSMRNIVYDIVHKIIPVSVLYYVVLKHVFEPISSVWPLK